jgi:hypothetical protein
MEEQKKLRNVFIALMLVGLFIFLVGSVISVKFIILDRLHKEKTYATITDISNNSTKVTYEVKGKIYNKRYSVYNSSYYEGKKVKIYYDKLNPGKSFIMSMRYLTLIVPGIGFIFLGISGIGLLYIYYKYYYI